MLLTTETIKPSDIDVRTPFGNTPLKNYEKDQVARNIVLISKWNGNKWTPFSFEEYSDRCNHTVGEEDRIVLDFFVQKGYLKFEGGKYSVTNSFLVLLKQFVIT